MFLLKVLLCIFLQFFFAHVLELNLLRMSYRYIFTVNRPIYTRSYQILDPKLLECTIGENQKNVFYGEQIFCGSTFEYILRNVFEQGFLNQFAMITCFKRKEIRLEKVKYFLGCYANYYLRKLKYLISIIIYWANEDKNKKNLRPKFAFGDVKTFYLNFKGTLLNLSYQTIKTRKKFDRQSEFAKKCPTKWLKHVKFDQIFFSE